MQALAADTAPHIEAATIAVLRNMTPAQKATMIAAMCAASDQLAMVGIQMRHRASPTVWPYALAVQRVPSERQAHARRLVQDLTMTYPVNPVTIAVRIGALLEQHGIRYYIGGSFASSIYGEYRTTRDLDVVVHGLAHQHVALFHQLTADFAFVVDDIHEALDRRAMDDGFVSFAMYDRATGYQVDVFLAPNVPYERVLFQRTFRATLAEGTVWVPSAEDAILNKLRWYQLTPSDMQWRDVQAMLRVQGDSLDVNYLRVWAAALNIAPLLAHALAGTRPIPPPELPEQRGLW